MSSLLSAALIFSMLLSSMPLAPKTAMEIGKETFISFVFWYHRAGVGKLLQGQLEETKEQEKQSERDAKVSRIEIFPKDPTVDVSDRVRFLATVTDSEAKRLAAGE